MNSESGTQVTSSRPLGLGLMELASYLKGQGLPPDRAQHRGGQCRQHFFALPSLPLSTFTLQARCRPLVDQGLTQEQDKTDA